MKLNNWIPHAKTNKTYTDLKVIQYGKNTGKLFIWTLCKVNSSRKMGGEEQNSSNMK